MALDEVKNLVEFITTKELRCTFDKRLLPVEVLDRRKGRNKQEVSYRKPETIMEKHRTGEWKLERFRFGNLCRPVFLKTRDEDTYEELGEW